MTTPTVASIQADIATLAINNYQAGYQAGSQASPPPPVPPPAPTTTFNIADYFPQPAPGVRLCKYLWNAGDPHMGDARYSPYLIQFYTASPSWDAYFGAGVPGWVYDAYTRTVVPDGPWTRASASLYNISSSGQVGILEWAEWAPPDVHYAFDKGFAFNFGPPGTALGVDIHSVQKIGGSDAGTCDVTLQTFTPDLIIPTGTFPNVLKMFNTQTQGAVVTPLNWWMTPGHFFCQVDYLNPDLSVKSTQYAKDIPEW